MILPGIIAAASAQDVVVPVPTGAPHRYWSILTISNRSSSQVYVGNMELREWPGGEDLTGTTGLAITDSVRADYSAEAAFNEIWPLAVSSRSGFSTSLRRNGWSPVTRVGSYIGWDFGQGVERVIREVAIQVTNFDSTGQLAPQEFTLRHSDDGASWTDVETFDVGRHGSSGTEKLATVTDADQQTALETHSVGVVAILGNRPSQLAVDQVEVVAILT